MWWSGVLAQKCDVWRGWVWLLISGRSGRGAICVLRIFWYLCPPAFSGLSSLYRAPSHSQMVSRMSPLEGSNSRIYLHHQYIENPLDPNKSNIRTVFVRIYIPRNTKYPTADIEKSTPGRCGDRPPIFLCKCRPVSVVPERGHPAHRQSPAVESSMPTHTATEMG